MGSFTPKAAGIIHTDFAKGFIKAEVYSFKIVKEFGSLARGSKSKG
jgi:ribosome-binding ATPase YchF (GTP1/OBG family)